MKPAIICATHVIGLAIIRSLGEKGVPVYALYYDPRDMGYVSKYVTKAIKVSDPITSESQFIKDILNLDEMATGGLVIPADDATVTAITRYKKKLQEKYQVAAVSEQIMNLFIDKKYTYELAASIGIPTPLTFYTSSQEEAVENGRGMLPCLIKPRRSHIYFNEFGRKMKLVTTVDELSVAFNEAHSASIEVMVQEYIEGDDTCGINYNSYFVDGKPVAEFTAEKIRYAPDGFGVPSAVSAKKIPQVINSGRAILSALKFEGYSCTEFKYDAKDDTYKFMEVNGRHNRSGYLASSCGLNFPWIEYCHLMLNQLPVDIPHKLHEKVWVDEFKDVTTYVPKVIKGQIKIRDFLKPYFNKPTFAVFNRKDIAPFFKRITGLCRMFSK